MRPDDRQLRAILEDAIRAPSAENQHHVQFVVGAGEVQLQARSPEAWAASPHRRMLALLAVGAMVENMALRSATFGLALHVQWLPEATSPGWIARVEWRDGQTEPSAVDVALAATMAERHTNRQVYRRALAPAALLDDLAAAGTVDGAAVAWLDEPARRRLALSAIRIAESERFRRRELHGELFGAIRFEAGWHRAVDEGLSPATLGVEPAMRLPFLLLRHWPVMRAASWLGAHHALGWRAGHWPCAAAPHLGMVVASDADDGWAALHAGRSLQRVWLAANAAGWSFQPMAAATALVRQPADGGWASAAVQAQLQALLGELALAAGRPYMLFRMGMARPPPIRSGRQPLETHLA